MTDCDTPSYDSVTSAKYLSKYKQAKKKNYLQACLAQRMHFAPLVFSMDGMMGRETEAFVKRLGNHLAIKWDSPFLRLIDYLLTCLRITCTRAIHQTLRGSRTPVHNMSYMLL